MFKGTEKLLGFHGRDEWGTETNLTRLIIMKASELVAGTKFQKKLDWSSNPAGPYEELAGDFKLLQGNKDT